VIKIWVGYTFLDNLEFDVMELTSFYVYILAFILL